MKIMKFYGEHCSLCKILDPVYNMIKDEFKDRIEFIEYEQSKNRDMFEKYDVMKLPTVIYFKGYEELVRHIKPEKYETIKMFIEKNMLVEEPAVEDKKVRAAY